MLAGLLERLAGLPPAAVYGVVAVLASLENVVPPVPADTAVALGAFLTRTGSVSVLGIFLVTLGANASSAALMYGLARTAGRGFVRGDIGRRLIRPAALARIEGLYARHGLWGIFLSRFIPGVRAVVPPFAGIAGLGAWRALTPTILASAIWYGSLVWLAAAFIQRADDVARLVARANLWVGVVALAVAVGLMLLWRRRRA